jgi:hypothetical protein
MITAKLKHMKQLIIIIIIALCVTNGFSQTDSIFEQGYIKNGYVDFYELLDIPHGVCEETFLGKLDKYFNQIGITEGYSSWQLHGYDHNRGTFFMIELFKDNQPISMGTGKLYTSQDVAHLISEYNKK